jgi:hypothetical protein
MNFQHTRHSEDRINNRLGGLTSKSEVDAAIASFPLKQGENFVPVKSFGKRIYLGDPRLPETPKGDKLVAKVIVDNRGAKVITVMLRKSTSVSERYQ